MGGNWAIQGQYCSFSDFYSATEFVCGDPGCFMASVMHVMFRFSCAGNIFEVLLKVFRTLFLDYIH